MNYVIYIIMSKNGMSPPSVLIQPYPLLSSSPFVRDALLNIVIRDWKFLRVLQLCQRRLTLCRRERSLDSLRAGTWQAPKLSSQSSSVGSGAVRRRWLSKA